jgi:signal transduction histidine kinase
MIDPMRPTGPIPWWRAAGDPAAPPVGPATTTLRSVIAYLATMIRCAGIVYILIEVVIWHSFYTAAAWHLAAPAVAVAWGAAMIVYLRRYLPSPVVACADSAVYVALALGAQACVPPAIRDAAFSWMVIAMSGQLIVPAWYWYAPGALPVLLALASPLAFWGGAMLQPVTNARTLTGAAILLFVIGLVHGGGRWLLYGRAAAADADLDRADQAAREQYAILCGNIERREHERLVHDTVLNTLTSVARSGGDAAAEVVARCRQDVALMEAALSADDLAPLPARPSGDARGDLGGDVRGDLRRDLAGEVRAVVAGMRDRGLTVHLEADDTADAAVPAPVVRAISNAVREALSNVAAHAGTGEAWVTVRCTALAGDAEAPCRLLVVIRDRGAGFDRARVDQARLGLRRSIAERTAECGGQASIRSAPGQGTEVSLSWPASGQSDAGHQADRTLARDGLPW